MKCKYDNLINHEEDYFQSEENHEAFHNVVCPICNYKLINFPKNYICLNCKESFAAKVYKNEKMGKNEIILRGIVKIKLK